MRDIDVRKSLRKYLEILHGTECGTLIVEEFVLADTVARADVAVLNGRMAGYEIKSDRDTLERLEHQVPAYSALFDQVTIVVGCKHADTVESRIPAWWGIIVATGASAELTEVREPQPNPAPDGFAAAALLWREEALELLKAHGFAKGFLSKARRKLWRRLVETLKLEQLRDSVREQLKRRADWRVDSVRIGDDATS